MTNKRIIGLLKSDEGKYKDEVIKSLVKKGFYRVSIQEKVNEFSQYILKDKEGKMNEIELRGRGYKVNRYYWINLILSSIQPDCQLIVVDDLYTEDIIEKTIIPFIISEQKETIDGINFENLNPNNDVEKEINKKILR